MKPEDADHMPRVSVVIQCYNMGKYIIETVGSVLSQTYRDFEIIVVDDASTDVETIMILDELTYPMIYVLRNSSNMGVAVTRNEGIQRAQGEFILTLDADDIICDTYLEKAVKLFDQQPEIGIVYSNAEFFGAKQGPWSIPPFSIKRMLAENLIFSAALFKKSDWQRSGGYRPAMSAGWEDWDFWLSMISAGVQVAKIPETLFRYRIIENSRDRSISLSKKAVLLLRILFHHRELYFSHPSSFIHLLIGIGKRLYGP